MTRRYLPGVPCWIDTEQPDPERARDFYARLLRWTAAPVAGHDDYLLAALDELTVAGIGPSATPAARWTTYIAVDDADAATASVAEHGGTVVAAPFDLGEQARIARCQDPSGVRFGVWQAREMTGAQVARIPGAWEVSDLHTGEDELATSDFYGAVFGWEVGTVGVGAGQWARMIRVPGFGEHRALHDSAQIQEGEVDDERSDRGGRDNPGELADAIGWLAPVEPADDGPDWRVSFTVATRDDAAHSAQRLGAEIVSERDTRWSRTALVRDPQGALFTLSQALSGR